MKMCIAFEASRTCASAWRPCANAADTDSVFCQRHRKALDGAVIGLFVHGFANENGIGEPRGRNRDKKRPPAAGREGRRRA